MVRYEPPEVLEVDVDGDLRGHGRWTLTETAATHVRFDWQVHADRSCCACSRRSCARPSAGTTTGRSPGPARGSSPTRRRAAMPDPVPLRAA